MASNWVNFNAIAFPTDCLKISQLKLGYYLLTTAVCSKRFYLANCTHEKCASYTRWSWLKREFNWTHRTRAIATWDHSLLTVNSDVCLPTPASAHCKFLWISIQFWENPFHGVFIAKTFDILAKMLIKSRFDFSHFEFEPGIYLGNYVKA